MPTKQAFTVHCNLFYPHLQTLTQQVRNALSSEQMLEQLQTHDCDLDLDNLVDQEGSKYSYAPI